jgi:phosphoribosylformylglycinamidine (FGAM) synthase PurS component
MGPYVKSGYVYKITEWAHTLLANTYIKSANGPIRYQRIQIYNEWMGPCANSEYAYKVSEWAHTLLANTNIKSADGPIRY